MYLSGSYYTDEDLKQDLFGRKNKRLPKQGRRSLKATVARTGAAAALLGVFTLSLPSTISPIPLVFPGFEASVAARSGCSSSSWCLKWPFSRSSQVEYSSQLSKLMFDRLANGATGSGGSSGLGGRVRGAENNPGAGRMALVEQAQSALPELAPLSPAKVVSLKVRVGEKLDAILARLGIGDDDKKKVSSSLSLVGEQVKSGATVEIAKGAGDDILGLKVHQPRGPVVSLSKTDQQEFRSTVSKDGGQQSTQVFAGVIKRSFRQGAIDSGVPTDLLDDFVDIFGDKVDFRKQLRAGDSFSILSEDKQSTTASGAAANRKKTILAASITANGKAFYAVRYVGQDGKARYFDESGKSSEGKFLRYPLKFTRISSVFSESRFHPVLKRRRAHNGVDFAAPTGTPVRSVGSGVVKEARYHSEMGNYVAIRHNDRYSTVYMHLHKIQKGIKAGGRVESGELIGTVGKTGLASGPHLHFALYDRGRFVDPMKGSFSYSDDKVVIPQQFLTAALETLKRSQAQAVQVAANQITSEKFRS